MKINPVYLDEEVLDQMIEFFNKNGYLQLQEFFASVPELHITNKKEIYNPLIEKKTQYDIVLQKEILDFIEEFLDSKIKSQTYTKYKHKDFILLNDKSVLDDGFDVIIDFTKEEWEKDWGGTLVYTSGEDEAFYLEPQYNTLTIIGTSKGLRKYLKYINNKSKNNEIKRIELSL